RVGHTATLLHNGKILVVGGRDLTALTSIEECDPDGLCVEQQDLPAARVGHTATLLTDGRVLIAGGLTDFGAPLDQVLIYDAGTLLPPPPPLRNARAYHSATLLSDGRVLFAGGSSDLDGHNNLPSTEVYDAGATPGPTLVSTLPDGLARHGHT